MPTKISCKKNFKNRALFFFLVISLDYFYDIMFYDLATPSRFYKNNWVGSFDLSYDLMFYDLRQDPNLDNLGLGGLEDLQTNKKSPYIY